ncbi:MAG: hypothetical protein HY362_00855 [Candidatus Aenigmarchaeota archaeon]|nr:hypothetical protein [Candidatus Aenigmarchaeota archaeon]
MPTKTMSKTSGGTCNGCGCGCPHHRWAMSIALIVAGAVYVYTANWGYTLAALGILGLLSGFCKCCGHK